MITELENGHVRYTESDRNLALVRIKDLVRFKGENDFREVEDCWSAGELYQIVINGNVLSYDINANRLMDDTKEIEEIEFVNTEDDLTPKYFPKLDVNLLPVLTVNGEDRIICRLTELDGLEINGPQTLKASYKHTIEARLYKEFKRKRDLLKEEKVICNSEEECREKLKEIEDAIQPVDQRQKDMVEDLFKKITLTF
jgi:flagellar biosynthesis regulator FlbT